jgi:hypothetical protein
MSCYEWEKGEIVLPKTEWASFRKTLIKEHNDRLTGLLAEAIRLHAQILEGSKGLRGENRVKKQKELLGTLSGYKNPDGRGYHDDKLEQFEQLHDLLFKAEEGKWERTILTLPKKKDLKLLPLTSDCAIELPDASIYIRTDSHTIKWSVPENNHACERARQHPVAQRLFVLLDQVKWTRGSGGTIVGNNEYNRDSEDAYGGGNFVVATYGPESAAEKRLRNMPHYWRGGRNG